jgi:hypothetical protein
MTTHSIIGVATVRRVTATLAVGVLLAGACGSDGNESGPTVLAADAEVGGKDRAALLGDYTETWLTEPLETSFFTDLSNCDMGSSTETVYFAPSFVEPGDTSTSCTMQAGQTLFVSPVGFACLEEGEEKADTACLDGGWDLTSSSVTVNGDDVEDLDEREVDTDVLSVTLAESNLFEVPPGEYDAIARGQVVLIADLPVGEHTIVQSGNFADGEFAGSLTMELTVEP